MVGKYKEIVDLAKQYGFPQTEEKEQEKLSEIHNKFPFHTILGTDDFLGKDAKLLILNEDEETVGCVIIFNLTVEDTFIRVWKCYDLRILPNEDLQYAVHLYDVRLWPEFHKNEAYINQVHDLLLYTDCENYDQFINSLDMQQKTYVLFSKNAQEKIRRYFKDREEGKMVDVTFN